LGRWRAAFVARERFELGAEACDAVRADGLARALQAVCRAPEVDAGLLFQRIRHRVDLRLRVGEIGSDDAGNVAVEDVAKLSQGVGVERAFGLTGEARDGCRRAGRSCGSGGCGGGQDRRCRGRREHGRR